MEVDKDIVYQKLDNLFGFLIESTDKKHHEEIEEAHKYARAKFLFVLLFMSEEAVEREITKVADKYNLDDDAKAKLKRYVEFFLEYKRRSITKKK